MSSRGTRAEGVWCDEGRNCAIVQWAAGGYRRLGTGCVAGRVSILGKNTEGGAKESGGGAGVGAEVGCRVEGAVCFEASAGVELESGVGKGRDVRTAL